jgi:ParB family transcriptional regulator, chromosome partitioning protein
MEKPEDVPIGTLIPYQWNNKIHGEAEVDRVANSINEFGWTYPILIDEKNIILAGHKRLLAAKKLGLEFVPILRKANLTETQKRAYRLIDNKSAEESMWHFENLQKEVNQLVESNFSLDDFCKFNLLDIADIDSAAIPEDFGSDAIPITIFKARIENEQADAFEKDLSELTDKYNIKYERL